MGAVRVLVSLATVRVANASMRMALDTAADVSVIVGLQFSDSYRGDKLRLTLGLIVV